MKHIKLTKQKSIWDIKSNCKNILLKTNKLNPCSISIKPNTLLFSVVACNYCIIQENAPIKLYGLMFSSKNFKHTSATINKEYYE